MQQKGFTLIELIIVIVILGILAVTATPRFIDIQTDARKETLQGVRAAIQGASQLVFAKAAIAGVQNKDTSTVNIGNQTVTVDFGYVCADELTSFADIKKFVDLDDTKLSLEDSTANDGMIRIRFTSVTSVNTVGSESGCYVEYNNATAIGDMPNITVLDNGC